MSWFTLLCKLKALYKWNPAFCGVALCRWKDALYWEAGNIVMHNVITVMQDKTWKRIMYNHQAWSKILLIKLIPFPFWASNAGEPFYLSSEVQPVQLLQLHQACMFKSGPKVWCCLDLFNFHWIYENLHILWWDQCLCKTNACFAIVRNLVIGVL